MDTRTGQLYDSLADALAAGVPPESVVEIRGGSLAAIAANARAKVARRKSRKR